MNIYCLDLNNFNRELLSQIASRKDMLICENKTELKKMQHLAGRFLLDYVAKKYHSIKDTSLVLKDKKPIFQNSSLSFSISHCSNLVVVAISDFPIGIDIEQNKKNRDFEKLISRFDKDRVAEFQKLSSDEQCQEFYKFWTQYEAKFKLGKSSDEIFLNSTILFDDFTLSIASTVVWDDILVKIWGEF